MVSEQPTRKMIKAFRDAGWEPKRTAGSHTVWACSCGTHTFTLPDGHRIISPGVAAKAFKALKACEEGDR